MGLLNRILAFLGFSPSIVREMVSALDSEIAYLESQGGGIRCTIYNGLLQSGLGDNVYRFTIETELAIPDDTPLEVRIGNNSIRGHLIAVEANVVTVALQQFIGEQIPQALLLSQPQLIYTRLRERLLDHSLRRELPLKLFGKKSSHIAVDFNFKLRGSEQPNRFQTEAIAKALGSDILFVWGPPGTGKTRTLAQCAQVFCQKGWSTLVLANTNVAVDNALNAIAKEMEQSARRTSIIRVGQPFSTLQTKIQIDKTGHSVREALSSTTRKPSRNIVVGTTLARSVLIHDLLSEKFDIVAVDEASMAPLPMLFYASSLSRSKVMAVGDFKQLPPIAMNDDSDLVKRWLKRDIFEEAGIVSSVERRQHDARMVMLREQYRMDPRICQLVNEFVYDGLLQNAQTVLSLPYESGLSPEPSFATVLVDTSEKNPWCSRPARSSSKINLLHATLAVALAREASKSSSSIAIIAPYRAQVRLIRKLAQDQKLESVQVSTIHRFQGREIDTVIFDVTDSDPLEPIWFTSPDSKKLVNVALSRAKRKLIIIANRSFVSKKLKSHLVDKVIDHIASIGQQVSASMFLPEGPKLNDPMAPLDPASKQLLSQLDLASFDEISFYPAFRSDLETSRSVVEIFSPFVTRRRVSFLAGDLRELIRRRVSVTLYTRPPEDQFDEERTIESAADAIQFLSKSGARIVEITRMHEKVALIDDHVCWHGSLNILSHADTNESMIRIVGQNLVRQIRTSLLGKPRDYKGKKTIRMARIGDLKQGMKGVVVQGKIIRIDKPRRVRSGELVSDAVIADLSGVIKISLWGDNARTFKVNEEIRVENAFVDSYRGELQLSIKFGKISKV